MKFLKELSKGKLVGHPIHVMLVHFPLALFPASLISDALSYFQSDPAFALLSFYCMAGGTIGGYIAAAFGMVDLLHLPDDKNIWKKALIHAGINGIALVSYTIMAALRMKEYPGIEIVSSGEIAVNAFLNISLFVSAYFGGDLVFRHKVGLIEKVDD